jgi:hypothetical protein
MSSSEFQPSGNGVALSLSATSNGMGPISTSNGVVVTNRSDWNAWFAWNPTSMPTATFPNPGDTVGEQGMEIPARAQVSIGVGYQDIYVAAVLESDAGTATGYMSIIPGDGL